jgi:hypothetical protein
MLGNPTAIVLTGSIDGTADTDVVQIPNNWTNWGTQLAVGADTQASGQAWYFQRVGYIDVNTPETSQLDAAGHPEELATPVYMIVNQALTVRSSCAGVPDWPAWTEGAPSIDPR